MSELFRGIIAPASLKPEERGRLVRVQPELFRGIIAPASLKQGEGWEEGVRVETFPGHHRPGLIEA